MATDFTAELAKIDLQGTVVRLWRSLDHDVALVRCRHKDAPPEEDSLCQFCECSFKYREEMLGGKLCRVHTASTWDCQAAAEVREQVMQEQSVLLGFYKQQHGIKESVLEIRRRAAAGEWLGERMPGMLYVQDVARLLGTDFQTSYDAVKELRVEEKVDLTGNILIDYQPHFRFPEEIRWLIRVLVEEPLGWPNGDAGDCAVGALERAIDEAGTYQHGRDLVWPHNFPNITPGHLAQIGLTFTELAVRRTRDAVTAGQPKDAFRHVDGAYAVRDLERLLVAARELAEAQAFAVLPSGLSVVSDGTMGSGDGDEPGDSSDSD